MAYETDYDVGAAFRAIEDELLSSMMRNMRRHRADEAAEGFDWSQWQAEQLGALERFKQRNARRYPKRFGAINKKMGDAIRQAYRVGGMDEEIHLLDLVRKGADLTPPRGQASNFFSINERKVNALIDATKSDMETAETAVLRMANDQYRKTIFNAQMYAATGAGTYAKAIDMATKTFLITGLNCIRYKNGARHTIDDYADMALKTACKRAYLQGEGARRQEWGVTTVIMNKRGNACPLCVPFVGKVLIDDVWSGGKPSDGPYPLMSVAIKAGLYHPRCKDSHTTYFPGISTPPDDHFSSREIKQIKDEQRVTDQANHARLQERRFERLAEYSLDLDNRRIYKARKEGWKERKSSSGLKEETNNGKIVSGAVSGARNPYSEEASEHAERYYGLVRSMTTDVKKIAKNTGYSESEIQAVKNYIFYDEHDLEDAIERFLPDYMMGESWRRLMQNDIRPHDLVMLKHELMEMELVKQGYSQAEAHLITSKTYNYSKEAAAFYDKIEKYKEK